VEGRKGKRIWGWRQVQWRRFAVDENMVVEGMKRFCATVLTLVKKGMAGMTTA